MRIGMIVVATLIVSGAALAQKPAIIPQPVNVEMKAGSFALNEATRIVVSNETGGDARALAESALYLRNILAPALGFQLSLRPAKQSFPCPGNTVELILESNSGLGEEGYRLSIDPETVSIRAASGAGLFYGIQTLRQLFPKDIFSAQSAEISDWILPAIEIEDQPRFTWRGMHLDVSRHFMPVSFIKRFISELALHKMNRFHWHLTDDQGWRIEIKKYPKLTDIGGWREETIFGHSRQRRRNNLPTKYDGERHGGFYTQAQIREIVKYARERHVTIVPEIEMPGHSQAAVAAYPEIGCTGKDIQTRKSWGISRDILNPNEATLNFMKNVLNEVMELFPSEYIHIGGDEAKKNQWENSPDIQRLREDRGLNNMEEMQGWFVRQITDFLSEKGRRAICWDNDSLGHGKTNTSLIVMSWHGNGPAIEAAERGQDSIMTPSGYTYFNFYQAKNKQKEPLAFGHYLPLEKVYKYEPIPSKLSAGEEKHILGAQAQLWSEYIPTPEIAEYMAFPRASAFSEIVWSPADGRNYENFLERLEAHLERLDEMGVNYRALDR